MRTSTAVLWNLKLTDEGVVRESMHGLPGISLDGEPESVYKPGLRTRVEEHHYAPGGKYRSVLKIHARHKKQKGEKWTLGTGWLITDDLVVTAGHVVRSPELGRAVSLKTYAGYHGLHSIGAGDVQTRQGKRVVVSKAYYDNHTDYLCDVALVRLEKPFENIQPFTHGDTPEQGKGSIGVVGYPADKDRNSDDGDLGPFMYEQFAHTLWNLHQSRSNLLQYRISTFGGQSGAPVILEGESRCIGTHIHGFIRDESDLNSASPIGGQYGIPYNALVEAIAKEPLRNAVEPWTVPLSVEEKPRKDPQHTSTTSAQSPTTLTRRKEHVYGSLRQYDTFFLVDDSDSMMDSDPVIGIKWNMTREVIAEIASIAVKHDHDGVEVQFFNAYRETEDRQHLTSAEDVMRLFEGLNPYGESLIATKLDEVLNEYCFRFGHDRDIKGLNLIVLTDGDPSPDQDIEEVIVKYARKLESFSAPQLKVGIQFVQIGSGSTAAAFFDQLDNKLKEKHNLDRDMVDTVRYIEGGSEPLYEKILLGGILKRYDHSDVSLSKVSPTHS